MRCPLNFVSILPWDSTCLPNVKNRLYRPILRTNHVDSESFAERSGGAEVRIDQNGKDSAGDEVKDLINESVKEEAQGLEDKEGVCQEQGLLALKLWEKVQFSNCLERPYKESP